MNMKTVLNKAVNGIIALGLTALIVAFATYVADRLHIRADLTEDNLYTLSEGTDNALEKMEEDVTIKFFFSRSASDLPVNIKDYARRVQSLLNEYRVTSSGRVAIETYDPKPDTDDQDKARSYSITEQNNPTNPFGEPYYFGMAVISGDKEETLPALHPDAESQLEYDITRSILRVSTTTTTAVGVISSLPVLGNNTTPQMAMLQGQQPQRPWAVFQYLQQEYDDVRNIPVSTSSIPDDISTLIVIHPKSLSEATLYALDQFVLRGGHLIAFVDPHSVVDQMNSQKNPMGMRGGQQRHASNMDKLFKAWGVDYDPGLVVADNVLSTLRPTRDGRATKDVTWLTVISSEAFPQLINRDETLTADLNELWLILSGALGDHTTDDLTFTPLVSTTPTHAYTLDAMATAMGGVDPQEEPDGEPRVLVTKLNGTFKTAFPDGKPAAEDADGDAISTAEPPALTDGESTIILFADVDLLFDQVAMQQIARGVMQPRNDNAILLANAVEMLSGSSDLIAIRSRRPKERPLTKVNQLDAEAREQYQAREQALQQKLNELNNKLRETQSQSDPRDKAWRSQTQKEAIQTFNEQVASTRRELREVAKERRRKIDSLGTKVKFINVALMPILVALVGIGYGLKRRFL